MASHVFNVTLSPVMFCRKISGMFLWQHNSMKCVPWRETEPSNYSMILSFNTSKKDNAQTCTLKNTQQELGEGLTFSTETFIYFFFF